MKHDLYAKHKKALKLCFEAHRNQVDKSGFPYVFHPFHLLHDVVENTGYSVGNLRRLGFGEDVISALKFLTYDESISYLDYVRKIKTDPIATAVKLTDLRHNSDLSRLDFISEQALERKKKYEKAMEILLGTP